MPIIKSLDSFFSLLPDMVRSQTHSHTTEPKIDDITASGGSSINTAVVFQAMSQQAEKLFGQGQEYH